MPLDVKVNIDAGNAEGVFQDTATAGKNLDNVIKGINADSKVLTETLKGLEREAGITTSIFSDLLNKLESLGGAKIDVSTIRAFRDEVKAISKELGTEGSTEQNRLLDLTVSKVENAIKAYDRLYAKIERANTQLDKGKVVNTGGIGTEAGQLIRTGLLSDKSAGNLQYDVQYLRLLEEENTARKLRIELLREEESIQARHEKLADSRTNKNSKEDLGELERELKLRNNQRLADSKATYKAETTAWDNALKERVSAAKEAASEQERIETSKQRTMSRLGKEWLRERLSEIKQVEQLEERAAYAGLKGPALVNARRERALAGITDPVNRARAASAFDTIEGVAEEASKGGLTYRLGRGVSQLAMATGMVDYRMYFAMEGMQNLAKNGAGLAPWILPALGGAAIGAVAVGGSVAAANSSADKAREYRNLAIELGTTPTFARQLSNAADVQGVSIGAMASGMRQLTQGLSEPGGRGSAVAGLLADKGIQVSTSTGALRETKDILMDISKVVRSLNDTEGRDFMEKLFGRGGHEILPMFKNLKELLGAVGDLNSGLDDAKLKTYSEAMSKLGLMWQNLVAYAAKPVVFLVDLQQSPNGQKISNTAFNLFDFIARPGSVYDVNTAKPGKAAFTGPPSDASDLNSGAAERKRFLDAMENSTKDGLQRKLKEAKIAEGLAFNTLDRSHAAGLTTSKKEEDDYTAKAAIVKDIEDKLKRLTAMEDYKDTDATKLAERFAKARAKESFGPERFREDAEAEIKAANDARKASYHPPLTAQEKSDIYGYYGYQTYDYMQKERQKDNTSAAHTQTALTAARIAGTSSIGSAQRSYDAFLTGTTGNLDYLRDDHFARLTDLTRNANLKTNDIANRMDETSQIKDTRERSRAIDTLNGEAKIVDLQLENQKIEENTRYKLANAQATRHLAEEEVNLANAAANSVEAYKHGIDGIVRHNLGSSDSRNVDLAESRINPNSASGLANIANLKYTSAQIASSRGKALAKSDFIDGVGEENARYNRNMSVLPAGDLQARKREEQRHEAEFLKLRLELVQQTNAAEEIGLDAQEKRVKAAVEAQNKQREQVENFTGNLLSTWVNAEMGGENPSTAVRKSLQQEGLSQGNRVFRNLIGTGFGVLQRHGVGQKDTIPGQVEMETDANGNKVAKRNADGTEKLTTLGKILQGTVFGHRAQSPLDINVKSISTDTKKIVEILEGWAKGITNPGGTGMGTPGFSMAGGILPDAPDLGNLQSFGGAGKFVGLPGFGRLAGSSSGTFGNGNVPYVSSSITPEGGETQDLGGTLGSGINGHIGQLTPLVTSGKKSNAKDTVIGLANDAAVAVNDIQTGIDTYKNAKAVFSGQTGKTGAGAVIGGLGKTAEGVAKVASTIPGGELVAAGAEIAALALGGIAGIMGNARKDRGKQLEDYAVAGQWTAPTANNLITTQNGQSATYDIMGAPRGYNGPLLSYPNTTNYTEGYHYGFNNRYGSPVTGDSNPTQSANLTVNIHALDSKSFMDHSHVLTDAVMAAMDNNHPINNRVSNLANPQ